MITLAGYLLLVAFGLLLVWVILPAHNRQVAKQSAQVSYVAPIRVQQPATYDYSEKTETDSMRLIARFNKLGSIAKARTRVIERLRADSAELQHEADSLFVEVIMAKDVVEQ